MNYYMNEGKKVSVVVGGKTYKRHAIKTRFVGIGESYINLFNEYVLPIYQKGDIVSISEKVISLCQNRIIRRENIKVSKLAKFLSKFGSTNSAGIGVSSSIKMQFAIDTVGAIKVIFASVASGITKLFGIKGVFYKIVGQEVSGLDGFYGNVWSEYEDMGILLPENPNDVCNEITRKTGVCCMIVDANDLGQEILGASLEISLNKDELKEFILDNPSSQGRQCTPFILIRKEKNCA